jgi:hypothetical protein
MPKFDQIEMVTGCLELARQELVPLGAGAMRPTLLEGRKNAAYWQIGNCFGLGIVPMRL